MLAHLPAAEHAWVSVCVAAVIATAYSDLRFKFRCVS